MKDGGLEQAVIECAPHTVISRACGEAEEVLFVVAGQGELRAGGERHALEPETGVTLPRGVEYELANLASDPMRIVCVRIRGAAGEGRVTGEGGVTLEGGVGGTAVEGSSAADASGDDGARGAGQDETRNRARMVVRRLADQEAHDATTDRSYRIVADPATGLTSATQFVGYIPTTRAPDHFHTYDEVIYILDGEGVFHAGGSSRRVAAGSCIELPARTIHCLENTGRDVMRLVAVFRPAGSPAAAYYPDGTPAYPGTPALTA